MSEGTADLTLSPSPGGPAEGAPRMRRNVSVLAGAQLITWTMTLALDARRPARARPGGLGTIMAAWSITGILGVVARARDA